MRRRTQTNLKMEYILLTFNSHKEDKKHKHP